MVKDIGKIAWLLFSKQKKAKRRNKKTSNTMEISKSKWINVKSKEQKTNALEEETSEIQNLSDSMKIENDSGRNQIEENTNIDELSLRLKSVCKFGRRYFR